MTEIFLIRHSIKDNNYQYLTCNDSFQVKNEKRILSVEGEEKARQLSKNENLKNISYVYSSHYVRAIETAKYIAYENNISLIIDENLCERKMGLNSYQEMPEDYVEHQLQDMHYKIGMGESLNQVKERMEYFLNKVLNAHEEKRIAIVSHCIAISALLSKWCQLYPDKLSYKVQYKDEEMFEIKMPDVIKLTFDKKELIKIEKLDLL